MYGGFKTQGFVGVLFVRDHTKIEDFWLVSLRGDTAHVFTKRERGGQKPKPIKTNIRLSDTIVFYFYFSNVLFDLSFDPILEACKNV